jgi:PhnB protein
MARILPLLVVDDIAQSMDYYEKTLGFKKTMSMPGEGGEIMHGEVQITDDITLMFSPGRMQAQTDAVGRLLDEKLSQAGAAKGAAKGAGVVLYFDLGGQDIDKYYDDVKRAGAKVIEEIKDQFWGDRNFTIEDKDGYLLTFSKHVRDVDFSQMQPSQQS